MASSAGRTSSVFRKAKANLRAQRRPCCRCGLPIDYRLAWPDPQSFSTDHYPYPLSTHPHLANDPGNLDAAHLLCNQSAGNGVPPPTLGTPSEDW